MSNQHLDPLSTVETAEWTRQKIELVRQTVAQDATDAELALFIHQCQRLGLDPLQRELVFTKYQTKKGPRVSFITTRDGYLKAAMQDPNYAGLQSFPVKEGDTFEIDPQKGTVHHAFGERRGKLLGAWAIAYHKTRVPVVFWAEFLEYFNANSGNPTWQQYPSAMIQKVAEVGALRRQFNVAGVLAQEEGMAIDSGLPDPVLPPQAAQPKPQKDPQETADTTANTGAGAKEKPSPTKEKETLQKPSQDPSKPQAKSQERAYTVQGARIVQGKSGKNVWQLALKASDDKKIIQVYAPEGGPIFEQIAKLDLPQGAKIQAEICENGNIFELVNIRLVNEEGNEEGEASA